MMPAISSIVFRKATIIGCVLLIISAMLFISCGGGTDYAGGGIGGTGVYAGVVSGFGSVWVNGIEFDTTGTDITVNGNSAAQGDLKVGMKVIVIANGTGANTITYESEIKGTIDINGVDTINNKLTVLGQAIFVDSTTVFDGAPDITGLSAGNIVEASGFFDASNNLHATHIEKKSAGGEFEVKGTISNLDITAKTFKITNLTIDYNGVTNQPSIANGSFVKAKGDMQGSTLMATKLSIKDKTPPVSSGNKVELEGIITNFTSQGDFEVNGQKVDASSAQFEHGTSSNLAQNIRVEVEGTINSSGVLIATKVEFKSLSISGSTVKLEGNVEAVDTVNMTVTIFGKTVQITNTTIFKDERNNLSPFTINNIAVNDFLEIGAFVDNSGKIIATKLERENNGNDELKGAVDLKDQANNRLVILGITIDVRSGATFKDINENPVSADTFFTTIDRGDIVEVEGSYDSGTNIFTATKAEIKKLN
ncbi:MAG: hypothetical protein HY756_11625 [Nitrospirae bacterium]|nr:hypothetical protein [Nitrospirota bacterium]